VRISKRHDVSPADMELPPARDEKDCMPQSRRRSLRGVAILELALLSPWFVMLIIGALDWGAIAYALISLEGAARTAALYTSSSINTAAASADACTLALGEMRKLPNIGTKTTCSGNPIAVTASYVIGPDGAGASQVSITYTTIGLLPIPGLLSKQSTITRKVIMRIRG